MSAELITPSELSGEADAYQFLEQLRWGDDGPELCPHCGSDKGAWYLQPKDPEGRKSKGGTSAKSQRRVWKCRESKCRRQFSVLTNTVMHGTKMPVQVWLEVVYALCSEDDGLSASDISERWGVAEKSALLMLTRIQHALERPEVAGASLAGNAPLWVRTHASTETVAAPRAAATESPEPASVEPEPERVASEPASVEPERVEPEAESVEAESVASEQEIVEAEARKAAEVKADVARALAEALGEVAPPVMSRTLRTGPATRSGVPHLDAEKPQPETNTPVDKPHDEAKTPIAKPSGEQKSQFDQQQIEADVQRALLDESLGPSWASDDATVPAAEPNQLDLFATEDDATEDDATEGDAT